jgi:hypothetical protein
VVTHRSLTQRPTPLGSKSSPRQFQLGPEFRQPGSQSPTLADEATLLDLQLFDVVHAIAVHLDQSIGTDREMAHDPLA